MSTYDQENSRMSRLQNGSVHVMVLCSSLFGFACGSSGFPTYPGPARPKHETATLDKPGGLGLVVRGPEQVVNIPEQGARLLSLAPGKHSVEWEPRTDMAFRSSTNGRHGCALDAMAGHRYLFQFKLLTIDSVTTDSQGHATGGSGTVELLIKDQDSQQVACTFTPMSP